MPRDAYEVLGVSRDAGEQQIKKSFRRLARELHPDVNAHDPQAEEKFKEAAEAYEILSDPERRATYDRYGHEGLRSGGFAPNFDGFGSISDLFDAFFGASSPFATRGGRAAGGDVAASIDVDLIDAARGTKVEVAYEAIDRCPHCQGNGAEPGTPIETCERCGGAGRLQAVTRTPFGQVVRTVDCDACHGDGKLARDPCRECRGRGRQLARHTLEVDIPAGIADGQRIRVSGHGHVGEAGAPSGDLYVLVRVRQDERFVREGDDLITIVDVSAPVASLGVTVEVPTLEGEHSLDVPAGTQPGEVLTLRGKGMPDLRRGRRGDLRVVVNIVVPRRLSHEQRDLLQELATSLNEDNLRTEESMFSKLRRVLEKPGGVIRLALRVRRDQAELALAELLTLAPSGVEERDLGDDAVEYAIYGAPGELPALPDLQAAAGGALVEVSTTEVPDDWSERWRDFHRPVLVGGTLHVRPPWEPARPDVIDIVIEPAQAFGTGAHATTRMCLELLLELAAAGLAGGPLLDIGCGSGVLSVAAARLGFSPVLGVDHELESVQATADNAQANGVSVQARRLDLRRDPLPAGMGDLTVTANLLRPLLLELADDETFAPRQLIASGLLGTEVDEVAATFAAQRDLHERARRASGGWAALWLAA